MDKGQFFCFNYAGGAQTCRKIVNLFKILLLFKKHFFFKILWPNIFVLYKILI